MVNAKEFAAAVFKAVDSMDEQRLSNFLADDGVFVFGNADPVKGRANIAEYSKNFLSLVRAVVHDLSDVWQIDDNIITRLRVTYTRHDGKKLSFPCVTIWQIRNDLIADYRIYIDNTPLFAV
jgi:ketosteroid isomerase-like protein